MFWPFNRKSKLPAKHSKVQLLLDEASNLLFDVEAIKQYNALLDVQNASKLLKKAQELTGQDSLQLKNMNADQTLSVLSDGTIRKIDHKNGVL